MLPHHLSLLLLWTVGQDQGGIEVDVKVKSQNAELMSAVMVYTSLSQTSFTCLSQSHLMDQFLSRLESGKWIKMCADDPLDQMKQITTISEKAYD